jgi:hypothetical protein
MYKYFSSSSSSVRRLRAADRRHFCPRGESLEARLALAFGVFNDDFSNDLDASKAGFDTAADGFEIVNDLPRYGVTQGPTGRQGYYYLQEGQPGDPGWGLHAHGHVLAILSSAFSTPQVTFNVPTPGTPGGHDADEEVSGIGVSVQGFGRVEILGAEGIMAVQLPGNSTWLRIAAYRNDLLPSGKALGAILGLRIYSSEVVVVDNVTVEVSSALPNTPPVAVDDYIFVNREFGASELFNPLDNDFDPQGDPIEFIVNTQPPRGVVHEFRDPVGNFVGFTYRADADALADPTFHEDSFTYIIRDTHFANASATVRLVLNTPPIAVFDEYELPHGMTGPLIIDAARGVLDNDFDRDDADSLTVTAHGQPRYGNVTLMPDGSFQYTPTTPDGRVLPDSFSYTISDGYSQAHSFVLIRVPNAVPSAHDDFIVVEHGEVEIDTFDVMANDPGDPDGDSVLAIVDAQPQHGTLHVFPDGRMRYVARGAHVFADSFTYRLKDPYSQSDGLGNLATVRILVPNRLPYALDDEYRVWPDTTLEVSAEDGVRRNDSDPEGDPLLSVTLTKQPGYGTVTLNGNGSFTYTPDGFFQGTDSFGYAVSDGIGESHAGMVTIVVTTGDPSARSDRYVIEPDSEPVELNLLENDWDPEGRSLSIAIPAGAFPSHGSILTGPNGSILYQPDSGFEGIDSFEYRVSNGISASSLVPVTLQVTDDPTVPEASFDHYSLLHDAPRTVPSTIGLLVNDSLDAGPFTSVLLDRPPEFGTLNGLGLNDGGAFTYTPNPGFVGFDTFRYWITDNRYESEAQTVSIQVRNEPPVANDDFYPVGIGSYVWANVLANDHDPDADDNDNLTVELTSEVPSGWLAVLEADGDFFFQPPTQFVTMHRFRYRVFDGAGYSQEAEIAVGGYLPELAFLTTPNRQTVIVESPFGTTLEASITATPPQVTPAGVEFPLGFFSFVVRNLPADGRADVRITLPTGSPPINEYWKYGQEAGNPHDHWYEFDREADTGAEFLPGEIILHFVDGGRGDATGVDGVIYDPGGPAFAELPPQIQSVAINDGLTQRSKVNSVTVTFSELVSIDPGAFEVRKIGARHPVKLQVDLSQDAGQTVARLTFKGAGITGGSLGDGQYRLTIDADKIRDAAGNLLDGDGDGDAGGDYLDEFFRRFGDTDGDGDVDGADKSVFKSAFGKRSSQPGYLWYLDFNANGRIWAEDTALFLLGYCRSNWRR